MGHLMKVKHSGNFKNTERFFSKALKTDYRSILKVYGERGVAALRSATPVDSGETAEAWGYSIEEHNGQLAIVFTNSHVEKGINIAVILDRGHGTQNGAWVEGRKYIHPAIQPIFDKIAESAWKEVIA